jgi:hypothetical protein
MHWIFRRVINQKLVVMVSLISVEKQRNSLNLIRFTVVEIRVSSLA